MKLYSQFTVFVVLIGFHQIRAEDFESEDAIVIEARFETFVDDLADPNCKVDTKLEARTESILETTVQPLDLDITTGAVEMVSTLPPDLEAEVINELENEPGAYPWLVEILKKGEHFCTGTLIDNRHVLTTAYCIYKLILKAPGDLIHIKVDLGFRSNYNAASSGLYQGPAMSQRVKKVIYHRHFNVTTAYNDIALLQLEHPIVFDKFVQPISLVEDDDSIENNLSGFKESIIGWNTSRKGAPTGEDFLARVSVAECRGNYMTILPSHSISHSMLCAGGESLATTCHWSFGSPLLTRPLDDPKGKLLQIGTFSWGIEALLPSCSFLKSEPKPMVFTRISSYADWIRRNLLH